MRVIFWGTSDFASPSLEWIYEQGYDITCIVTAPEKQAGRGLKLIPSPVKITAEKIGLKYIEPENPNTDDVLNILTELKPDVCVLAAYGFLIKSQLLNLPEKGFINIHPSLLPKYRGAAPIQRAIINGEKITGVTTFYMNEAMDAGDIILQAQTDIDRDETFDELKFRLALIGADLIIKSLNLINEDRVQRITQDVLQKTLAKKIKKEDCIINWEKPAVEIHNLIRGLSREPGAYTNFRDKRARIIKSTIPDQLLISNLTVPNQAGKIVWTKKHLLVDTGNGLLQVLSLQLEGGKIINALDFINGQRLTQEDKFK